MISPIGKIRTPYKNLEQMPIQPKGAAASIGSVILDPEYSDGLMDLEGFSHIYLIYQFHQSQGYKLRVTPFLDNREHGVFATRAPRRPNPIGLSIVELVSVENNWLKVRGADMLDGTPILDIKPYLQQFDHIKDPKSGWLTASEQEISEMKSDQRFITES